MTERLIISALACLWLALFMLPIGARIYDYFSPWETAIEVARMASGDGSRDLHAGDELRWIGTYEIHRECTGTFHRVLEVWDPDSGEVTPYFFFSHPGSVPLKPQLLPLRGLLIESIPERWRGMSLTYTPRAEIDCWPWIPFTTQDWEYPSDTIQVEHE